eukprot:802095-Lingulodinium_polyedra.AAC.1
MAPGRGGRGASPRQTTATRAGRKSGPMGRAGGPTGGEHSPRRANRTPDHRLAPYWNRGKRALLRIGNPAE